MLVQLFWTLLWCVGWKSFRHILLSPSNSSTGLFQRVVKKFGSDKIPREIVGEAAKINMIFLSLYFLWISTATVLQKRQRIANYVRNYGYMFVLIKLIFAFWLEGNILFFPFNVFRVFLSELAVVCPWREKACICIAFLPLFHLIG